VAPARLEEVDQPLAGPRRSVPGCSEPVAARPSQTPSATCATCATASGTTTGSGPFHAPSDGQLLDVAGYIDPELRNCIQDNTTVTTVIADSPLTGSAS
jgi:hypothetical protein